MNASSPSVTIHPAAAVANVADARYHQNWVPVCLETQIADGGIVGVDVLGSRVVAYLGPGGRPVVQTAWCPHLGADLSGGAIVEGELRCPYHHWRFAADGPCVHIPTGDKIPPGATLPSWPAVRAWGLIWTFVGKKPLFSAPRMPGAEEDELALVSVLRGERTVPPWVSVSNAVDFQHLRTVHNLPGVEPSELTVGDHGIEYVVESETARRHGLVTGTNVFAQHLRRPDGESFVLFAGAPIDQHRTRSFFVVGVRRTADERRDAVALQKQREFVEQLLAEDEPILNSIRFRKGLLVASDRHLARYFKYVANFPLGEF